jgi:neutral ceramidase
MTATRIAALLMVLAIGIGCDREETTPPGDDDTDGGWPTITPDELHAGTADGTLDLPVGLPLSAYTGRSNFFGADPVDGRDSSYTVNFVPSNGVQTRIPMHVVWLAAGDQHAVLVKIDIAYAFDGLVNGLEIAISEATGIDVTDKVFLMTGHSHSAYGDFSQAHFLFLGHDRFNLEIFERVVAQASDLATDAHERLVPAAIGVGLDPQFDPDDEIFRSRRNENVGLMDDFGVVVDEDYKDPNLYLVRVDASQGTADAADDTPLAILFGFGVHGTIMGEDNPLVSSESTGAIELKLENLFDEPLTLMHFQVDGGDMSPAGSQDDFARMEDIGERAAPRIRDFWEQVETTTDPVVLEPLVRTVSLGRDIRVTRDGTVDYHYLEYDEGYEPDLLVWGEDGEPLNPFDEFTAPYGAGLCGETDMEIPFVSMNVLVPPYNSCALVDLVAALFPYLFYTDLYYEMEFPLWETRSTLIGALGIDSVPVTVAGEGSYDDQLVISFLPGEVCTMAGRSLQARLAEEQGIETSFVVGYAMDHEGYLMTVEDWLSGGYEPAINLWGPLQGEYTIERMLELTELLGTDVAEDPAFPDFADQEYPAWPLETVTPDAAPGCGTVPDAVFEDLWSRDGWQPAAPQPDDSVRRMSGQAHFVFIGGDPALDLPEITLQREQSPGDEDWEAVTLPNGLPLTDRGYDMILSYTPDPLVELYEEVDRHHYWLVEWQAVTDRPSLSHAAGVPAERYRFVASGLCTDPDDAEYPFEGIPYEVASDPFEVTGEDAVEVSTWGDAWGGSFGLDVAYRAPSRPFRLLHMGADYRGRTPIVGGDDDPTVTVELRDDGGALVHSWDDVPATQDGDHSDVVIDTSGLAGGAYTLQVIDVFGNSGSVGPVGG